MLFIAEKIKKACIDFANTHNIDLGLSHNFEVDIIKDMQHGDLYTNFALVYAKAFQKNPISLAIELGEYLHDIKDDLGVIDIQVAGAYINFYIPCENIYNNNTQISHPDFTDKKIVYEYTDPNPMKEFHIGHLMSNTIGESLSRLGELAGADIKRYSYQGDTGRHLAVTMWGLRFMKEAWPDAENISITDKVKYLGQAYVEGNSILKEAFESGEESEIYKKYITEIELINQKIYDRSDEDVNAVYDQAREWSLQKFEELYQILGTSFDHYFFESITGPIGFDIVKENINSNSSVFSKGENDTVIYDGEKDGLHTRVFINSKGLPTYETKEIGLAKQKYELWPYDKSIIITANEQNEVFKITSKVITSLMPEIGSKNTHVSHGMMRLVGQKMSSRTGKIVAGDELIEDMMNVSYEKMKDRDLSEEEKQNIALDIAVSAVKFSILKQNFRKDIIFDKEKALSLDGDSGPYIQYAIVRIKSIEKKVEGLEVLENVIESNVETQNLKRMLLRYQHVCFKAIDEMAPQYIAQYLIELSSRFNSFYIKNKIIEDGKVHKDLLDLCVKTSDILSQGLQVLGIRVVEKM